MFKKLINKITSLSNTKKVLLLTILIIIVQILFLNVQSVFKPLDIFLILIKAALLVLIFRIWIKVSKEKGNEKFLYSNIFISVVIMFTSLFFIVYHVQNDFLFHPGNSRVNEQNHENLDASVYEVIQFKDYTGYYKKGVEGSNHLILYFGGNSEYGATTIRKFGDLEDLTITEDDMLNNYNVLMFDYPGYGKSKGQPKEQTIFKMALDVYDFVISDARFKDFELTVAGFSIGTGPASYLAKERNVKKLILVAPYTNGYDLFNQFVPIFYGPTTWILTNQLRNDQHLKDYKGKLLILATTDDELVKYELTKKLVLNLDNVDLTFKTREGFTHNYFFVDQASVQIMSDFIES